MAFGSGVCHSEGEDGKDVIQQFHGSEAHWVEVVEGSRIWPRLQKPCHIFIPLDQKDI